MLPAQERLDGDDPSFAEVDRRLVMQEQLVTLDPVLQLSSEERLLCGRPGYGWPVGPQQPRPQGGVEQKGGTEQDESIRLVWAEIACATGA